MDNISRALAIAGGMLFAIFIVTLLIYAWTAFSEYQANQDDLRRVQDVTKFNQQYTNYYRDDVQGYELLSLINKVIDYNQRYSTEFNINSAAGNKDQYKPLSIEISLIDESGVDHRDYLTALITIPATTTKTLKEYKGKDYRLFNYTTYIQNNTINQFKSILDEINNIESNFGGASNTQSVVKSKNTYFESKVIGYNGHPSPTEYIGDWYQAKYIINKFETLTGKILIGLNEDDKLDYLRNATTPTSNIIQQILKYYEYMEFKKFEFKCTDVKYDDYTGRVIEMKFKIN